MKRFIEGANRGQSTMFPDLLEDHIDEDNQVRVVDVFVDRALSTLTPHRQTRGTSHRNYTA